MQKTRKYSLPCLSARASSAFTLMETVIAIGVLAVLLTGFIAVFTPAAQGIRRSISSQQADRLTSTLERELVTLRKDVGNVGSTDTSYSTGFQKAFNWIKEGNWINQQDDYFSKVVFVYQYRGNPAIIRADGTPKPMESIKGQPGVDYIVQSMARRMDEGYFQEDLKAIEGSIFFVKPTQLVFSGNEMVLGEKGQISYLENGVRTPALTEAQYKEAVIAFSAEFHSVPTKAITYLKGDVFKKRFKNAKPVFTRNLAVRR